jgi:hypothetical protein
MQEHTGSVRSFIDVQRRNKFTGGIKIGFSEGNPNYLSFSDSPDFDIPSIPPDFKLDEKLSMVTNNLFSGSLFLVLDQGNITKCGYHQTLQGRRLSEFLIGCKAAPTAERRIVVRGKR